MTDDLNFRSPGPYFVAKLGLSMNWFYWSLLSAFFAGATVILAKAGVSGIDSNLATAVRTSVVVVLTWGIACATTKIGALGDFSKRTWIFLIFSGVATAVSWLCYFKALQVGEASRVAPVDKLSVVFAIAFATFFLGERLTLQHWVGGALIVTGSLVVSIR